MFDERENKRSGISGHEGDATDHSAGDDLARFYEGDAMDHSAGDDLARFYEGDAMGHSAGDDLARFYEGDAMDHSAGDDLARFYEGDAAPKKTDDSQGMEHDPFDISKKSLEELFALRDELSDKKEQDNNSGYSR